MGVSFSFLGYGVDQFKVAFSLAAQYQDGQAEDRSSNRQDHSEPERCQSQEKALEKSVRLVYSAPLLVWAFVGYTPLISLKSFSLLPPNIKISKRRIDPQTGKTIPRPSDVNRKKRSSRNRYGSRAQKDSRNEAESTKQTNKNLMHAPYPGPPM